MALQMTRKLTGLTVRQRMKTAILVLKGGTAMLCCGRKVVAIQWRKTGEPLILKETKEAEPPVWKQRKVAEPRAERGKKAVEPQALRGKEAAQPQASRGKKAAQLVWKGM